MSTVRQRKKHSKQKDVNKEIIPNQKESNERVSVVNVRIITGKLQLIFDVCDVIFIKSLSLHWLRGPLTG